MPPRPSPTCCLGSLPGPPLPSYHQTLRFRTPYYSALHLLVLLSDSSFLKQTQALLGQSQPREQGFSPHPHAASLGVPSSPATSPEASLRVQPALYMLWTVLIASAKRSAEGKEGLGSRHLPHCSAGWAQAERQCLVSRLQRKDTGRARSWWTAKGNFVTAQQNEASLESASDSQEVGLGVLFCILRSLQGHQQPATIIFRKELREINDFQESFTLFCP